MRIGYSTKEFNAFGFFFIRIAFDIRFIHLEKFIDDFAGKPMDSLFTPDFEK